MIDATEKTSARAPASSRTWGANQRKSPIIATEQRVSPAGVQSVFTDRVFGVRFGKPGEIWVTVHGAAYRLAWQDNVVRASAAFDGRSGVQGIAIDPVNGRALFSTVGRLPQTLAQSRTPGSDEMSPTDTVTQLSAYDGDAVAPRAGGGGDSAVVRWSGAARGGFIAGAPAVAARANTAGGGHRDPKVRAGAGAVIPLDDRPLLGNVRGVDPRLDGEAAG